MRSSAFPVALLLLLVSCSSEEPSVEGESSPTSGPVSPASSAPASSADGGHAAASFETVERGSLPAGSYVLNYASIGGAREFPTLAVTFTLPAGWERVVIDGVVWNAAGTRIGFAVVDNLFVDPCDPDQGVRNPPVGPSVDDLAWAMGSLPGWELTEADSDVYMGYPGIRLVLRAPAEMSSCPFEESRLAHSLGFPGFMTGIAGGEQELWILSVEGTRLVISATSAPNSSAADLEELQAVIDSIAIQP